MRPPAAWKSLSPEELALATKVCSTCKTDKPLVEFFKGNSSYNRENVCKICSRATSKKWRLDNPEKYKQSTHKNYVDNKEHRSVQVADWQKANPERRAVIEKKSKAKNAAKIAITARAYRQDKDNNDKIQARRRKRYAEDPVFRASVIMSMHKRRVLIENSSDHYTAEEWLGLCELYNYACLVCGLRAGEVDRRGKIVIMTPDHIIPISMFGSNGIDNIQPLCLLCNSTKNDKIIDYRPDFLEKESK